MSRRVSDMAAGNRLVLDKSEIFPIFFKISQETGYFCMVPPKNLPFYSILEQ